MYVVFVDQLLIHVKFINSIKDSNEIYKMLFTERLFKETCESHKQIDRHRFVKNIRDTPLDAIKYIQFNERCICEIQSTLNLTDNCLEVMLYRNIKNIPLAINSLNMKRLLQRCKEQPLYHAYMFYLGLLAGGKLLMKYIPLEYTDILQFQEDTKYLIERFKNYLNDTVVNVEEQSQFIKEVNESYVLIGKCFDEFSPIGLKTN